MIFILYRNTKNAKNVPTGGGTKMWSVRDVSKEEHTPSLFILYCIHEKCKNVSNGGSTKMCSSEMFQKKSAHLRCYDAETLYCSLTAQMVRGRNAYNTIYTSSRSHRKANWSWRKYILRHGRPQYACPNVLEQLSGPPHTSYPPQCARTAAQPLWCKFLKPQSPKRLISHNMSPQITSSQYQGYYIFCYNCHDRHHDRDVSQLWEGNAAVRRESANCGIDSWTANVHTMDSRHSW